VERAERAVDPRWTAQLQKKVMGKGKFTLEDFLVALKQVQKMGPLEQLVKLIPGMAKKLPTAGMDPKRMKHVEAIVLSMTPEERRTAGDPERIQPGPDREGKRETGGGGEPSPEAVQGDAEDDEAAEGDAGHADPEAPLGR
jgi:signal recognition particle GTPase